jgi:hypothetical protein
MDCRAHLRSGLPVPWNSGSVSSQGTLAEPGPPASLGLRFVVPTLRKPRSVGQPLSRAGREKSKDGPAPFENREAWGSLLRERAEKNKKMGQPRKRLITSVECAKRKKIGSVRKFVNFIEEVSDEPNSTETIERDIPPKPARLFVAVDPPIKTHPDSARRCKNRSRTKCEDAEYQKNMRRSYEYRSEQCYYKQNWGNELHWNRLDKLNLTAIGYWLAENPDSTHWPYNGGITLDA